MVHICYNDNLFIGLPVSNKEGRKYLKIEESVFDDTALTMCLKNYYNVDEWNVFNRIGLKETISSFKC